MSRMTFLLAKDPALERSGDVAIMELLLGLARRRHQVSVICLSEQPHLEEPGFLRLPKPRVNPAALAVQALRARRSLVHTRFCTPELVAAVEDSDAETFVAVHSYMAEAVLGSSRRDARLLVTHVVPEADVWRHGYGLLGRQQARAIDRDEARVARAADAVGAYDERDARLAGLAGARRAVWLEVTLPPAALIDVGASAPRLVLLGDRTWSPNQQAFEELLRLWPQISAGIDGAELVVVGRARSRGADLPAGVRDLGFVPDLDEVLGGCRALVAPIRVGGGVRVKLLEAASRGLPVVATDPAAGSLSRLLGISPHDLTAAFVAECRRLLLDREAAAAEGRRLFEANLAHWAAGRPGATFDAWVGG